MQYTTSRSNEPLSNHDTKPTRLWQEIAAEAAKETDSEKLIALAVELDLALEARDQALRTAQASNAMAERISEPSS
jgi:hypothetical protein